MATRTDRRSSFHSQRMTSTAAGGRPLENDEQRNDDKRRDHQQLVIVDVGNDLRLLRNHGIQ